MIKVVFVGHKPSRLNVDPNIAFVGARCFPRLVEWIKYINPDYYICLNINNISDSFTIRKLSENNFKIVALGKDASCLLDFYKIAHFQLPHPSGLNRLINDKEYIERKLKIAYKYVNNLITDSFIDRL